MSTIIRLMLSDGSIKHIHTVLHPLTSNSGKTSEIIATAADITDRVRSESELRRSEAYLAEAEKISHTGCWARNPTTGALFWSQEEWRIFGLDPAKTKLSYEMFLQMIHPDDRASLEETSTRAVREKRSYDIPFRIVLPDGSIKHIHSVGKPFFEKSGGVTEYIGVSMDVTERKRDEAALQLAQAELARVARLTTIGELAASIAHEINQPLSAIGTNGLAALRWLGHEVPNVAEAKQALERISKEAQRANDVIDRIRALLKHDKPKYTALDINDVIKEVVTMTQSALQARGVSVQIDLSPGLPRATGGSRSATAGAHEFDHEWRGCYEPRHERAAYLKACIARRLIRQHPGFNRRLGHRTGSWFIGPNFSPLIFDEAQWHGDGLGDLQIYR